MNPSEKFGLKWNDFQENVCTAITLIRRENEFTDVTLACEDGNQVEAHKVILGAFSPILKNIFMKKQHTHPFIYMRGIQYEDLLSIVDFIYNGQTNVFQDNLDNFLVLAEELKLKGLSGVQKVNKGDNLKVIDGREGETGSPGKYETDELTIEEDSINIDDVPGDENTVSVDPILPKNNHIQSQHSEKVFVCSFCNKSFSDRGNMLRHIKNKHEKRKLECSFCKKMFTDLSNMNRHISNTHTSEGKEYNCMFCDHVFNQYSNMKKHLQAKHLDKIRYIDVLE